MSFFPSTCDVYRPFGDSSPMTNDVPCRLSPDFAGGQQSIGISWTHTLDLPADADVRDGCTRSAESGSLSYADGDEIRIAGVRYVVVWVEPHCFDGPTPFQRAYLLRHGIT